jgi:hypothetical protein
MKFALLPETVSQVRRICPLLDMTAAVLQLDNGLYSKLDAPAVDVFAADCCCILSCLLLVSTE